MIFAKIFKAQVFITKIEYITLNLLIPSYSQLIQQYRASSDV